MFLRRRRLHILCKWYKRFSEECHNVEGNKQRRESSIWQVQRREKGKSKFKATINMHFYVKGVILEEGVTEGTTVNRHYYKYVSTKLTESKRTTELWKNNFIFYQNNVPVHTGVFS